MSHGTSTRTGVGLLRRYPFDLALTSLAAAAAYLVVTSYPQGSALRLGLALPLILFLPGYALVSLLFPAADRSARASAATVAERRPRGIDLAERLALSLALSIAIVPVLAMGLAVTEWGLATESVAAGLAFGTVGLAQVGVVRRLRTPEAQRFSVAPLDRLRSSEGGTVTLSGIVLAIAIGAAVSALLVAILLPASAGGFTELALYTENDEGELVAGDFPDEIAPGEPIPMTVSIENQEGTDEEYTVVVQQQRFENGDVVDRTALETADASVADGATGRGEWTVTPTANAGETVRISVLLYDGEPPAEPTNENAAEDTYFWVTVSDG
ncbi:DUF1616 domain-containing protein [Halosolutus gelatinilyticus]|uniref:DUF1616 domain-containing protein n=1 Tax=Halosolutus gelatinilyticus TaxID=2931975 RepID=UPI001FF14ED1|nr:DUF1616 domain-containing protein [Halosolutus gelatinilyticus]